MDLFQGTTLAIVTVAIGLLGILVAVAGVLYTRRTVLPPKRRLSVSELPPASLLSDESASAAGVRVTYQDSEVTDPYIATLSVANTGTHAVGSDQFDKDRAISIDVGAPIKTIVKTSVVPGSGAQYASSFDKTCISLGPDLLNPGQTVIIQALTEGRPQTDDLDARTIGYLKDTDLDFRNRQARPLLTISTVVVGMVAIVGVVASAIALYSFLSSGSFGMSISVAPDNGPVGTPVTVTGKGAERFAVIEAEMPDPSPSSNANETEPIRVATTQADRNGKFRFDFKLPSGYDKGAVTISVRAEQSNSTSYDYVEFYVR